MAKEGDLDKLVRYTSEKLAAYLGTPKAQRKAYRLERSNRRESWSYRWFGLLPFAIAQWISSARSRMRKFLRR